MKLRFELFVENIEASVAFYKDVLGFRAGVTSYDYVDIYQDSVEIGICRMEKLPETHPLKTKGLEERKGLGVEIVLEVDDIDAFYHRVLNTGYPIDADLQMQPWKSIDFRLLDPDGYYIRITGN